MGNNESAAHTLDTHPENAGKTGHMDVSNPPARQRQKSAPSNMDNDSEGGQFLTTHAGLQRSHSVPQPRYRQDSVGSYSSSLEGAYGDPYDGMSPRTFGGDYHKDTPKKYRSESFDDAHGNKLKMPFDSKHGSGFDLDWQYNDKVVRRVVAKRSLNPDHPLYHKLTSKVLEEDEQPVRIGRKHQI